MLTEARADLEVMAAMAGVNGPGRTETAEALAAREATAARAASPEGLFIWMPKETRQDTLGTMAGAAKAESGAMAAVEELEATGATGARGAIPRASQALAENPVQEDMAMYEMVMTGHRALPAEQHCAKIL